MTLLDHAPALPLGRVPSRLLLPSSAPADAVALVTGTGETLSHRELAVRVAERAAAWGPERRLVLIEGGRTLDHVITHLAAIEYGHVALVVPVDRDHSEVRDHWQPDIVALGADDEVLRETSAHDLHPDLCLLLSTSGSTGSPKLVRLSRDAVRSNALAIAEYLGLRADDRALCSLPLHYCYGLSVLHSHLAVGASVVLTETSVVDPCFWQLVDETRATSLAGVPHTFDLLDRTDFATTGAPSLRRITQAGGRLAPEAVTRWARTGREQGWDLVVMYGATEATARMAWLPPDLADTRPGSIGRAIPGGSLRIDRTDPDAPAGVGELVYSGPNVMMGYAHTSRDLARGPELSELRTGDLARERDGLFEIVGRLNRMAKLFGLRLDLPRIEQHLSTPGRQVTAVADERHLHLVLTDPDPRSNAPATDVLAQQAARFCGLPGSAVRVHVLAELPRTPNDKVDLRALTELCAEGRVPDATVEASPVERVTGGTAERVTVHYEVVLGARPGPGDTFVTLGGDSLSFVELATRLEGALAAPLPTRWHLMTVSELLAALPEEAPTTRARTGWRRWTGWGSVDTVAGLRALAVLAIVASHVDLVDLKGGAHLLLVLAGFNLARFQLAAPTRTGRVRALGRGLVSLATAAVPWIGGVALVAGTYHLSTVFLSHQLTGHQRWSVQWQFWFLEALVWTTLAVIALLAIGPLDRLERAHPYAFALGLVLATAALRYAVTGWRAGGTDKYSIAAVAFFVALGWLAARSSTTRQKVSTMALAFALVPGFFGSSLREGIVLVGLALVLTTPRLWVPRACTGLVGVVATASLAIYVTQWQVYPPLEDAGLPWLALVAALAVGVLWSRLVRPVQNWSTRHFDRLADALAPTTTK